MVSKFYHNNKLESTFLYSYTASVLIGTTFSLCIIIYEQTTDNKYRALTNRLFSLQMTIGFLCFNFHYIISCIRGIYGPLSSEVCQIWNLFSFVLSIMFVFLINEIVFIRYLYVCYFKCVGVLNEDFLFQFSYLGKLEL